MLIMYGSGLFCLLVIGWQVFLFLRDGMWFPFGALTTFGQVTEWPWALSPDKWYGLHAIIEFFNIGFLVGAIGLFLGGSLADYEAN